MNRFKLFLENFLIYGLGGVIGKMIPLFMLPVITRILPDSYYMGLNDLSNTILSFAQSLAVLGMYDAMFRMFFEKEDSEFKKEICSSALAVVLISSSIISFLMTAFWRPLAEGILGNETYRGLILVTALSAFFSGINSIVSAPTRMQNKRKIYLFTNAFTPVVSYAIAVLLLLQGQFVYGLQIGQFLAMLLTELIFISLNHDWFSLKRVHWGHIKIMLAFGLPLLPNFLIYWIFNSSDRLMIASMLGMKYVGIYAVGSKFGHISQLIYTAFAGGWQYFSFSTMHDRDQVELTSKIFEYLGTLSLTAAILVTLATERLFVPLFGESYAEAAVTVPYLFLAPLTQMLYQIAANQFLVIKKTWPASIILFVGAIGNVLLNALLIPLLGIEGAAISTMMGFAISMAIGVVILQKMRLFQMPLRFLWIVGLYLAFLLSNRLIELSFFTSALSGAAVICIYMFSYWKEIQIVFHMIKWST